MNKDQTTQGVPADETAAADATVSATAIRQEEQGQQSHQEAGYPAVDFGSCWYHEEAVHTAGR